MVYNIPTRGDIMTLSLENQPISPSKVLSELMIKNGITLMDLTNRLGMSAKDVNEVLLGKKPIDHFFAEQLSYVFEFDAKYWGNLQLEYDIFIERIKTENNITASEIKMLDEFDIEKLQEWGYLKDYPEAEIDRVLYLRKFIRITDLSNIRVVMENGFSYKAPMIYSNTLLASWLSLVYIGFQSEERTHSDLSNVRRLIPLLKSWSELSIDEIEKETFNSLQESGIYFIVLNQFDNLPIRSYIRNINGTIIFAVGIKERKVESFIRAVAIGLGNLLTNRLDRGLIDLEQK